MWQQQHDAVLSDPLGLTGTDELIDDALSRVVEVSELSLPQDQSVGTRHRKAQLKAWRQIIYSERSLSADTEHQNGEETSSKTTEPNGQNIDLRF